MLKTLRWTAALSFILLVLVSGCSTAKPPLAKSQETMSDDSTTKAEKKESDSIPFIVPPDNPDPVTNAKVVGYVKLLAAQGSSMRSQGVWMQSGNTLLANYEGTVPLPAASLTKVATSLVALQTFGPEHEFITQIGATGPIQNGVLKGDLVVEGGQDPLFVWEEAIAVGNLLNQMGIKRVTGNLVIAGKFYMNFKTNPQMAGNMLKLGLNSKMWPKEAQTQYQSLPPGTPKPQVAINGSLKVLPQVPSNVQPLVRHHSLPLAGLLKKMNQFSNNYMAEMLADAVGGAKVVAQKAAETARVPLAEIQLVNGSGLAPENRISPRAVCAMFRAIENYLQPKNMTVADVFAVVGKDEGILAKRPLPPLAVVKSGSLDTVSALAGALPTQKQGTIWFAIMNSGGSLEAFRTQQETLLKSFVNEWGVVAASPVELTPHLEMNGKTSRTEIVQ